MSTAHLPDDHVLWSEETGPVTLGEIRTQAEGLDSEDDATVRMWAAKLTEADAAAIKARVNDSNADLAREYGVGAETIRSLRSGETWRHVAPATPQTPEMPETGRCNYQITEFHRCRALVASGRCRWHR